MGVPRFLLVVSETDPVAPRVAERWGTPPSVGHSVEGAPIRALSAEVWTVRRPGHHVHDEGLVELLPPEVRSARTPLVFPSVHRSQSNTPCLTVHPLGNPGPDAEVGGAPGQLTPAPARLMADALRRASEIAAAVGVEATYEATHHGPLLSLPACFIEIGFGTDAGPPPETVRRLADALQELRADDRDRIAVGLGGGHYVPHFTELALTRRWAFGHMLSKHSLAIASPDVLRATLTASAGAEGFVYQRAQDETLYDLQKVGKRLRDQDAPLRDASD